MQVVSTAQSTAASIQIANGVGRHRESLSPSKIDVFEKVGYTRTGSHDQELNSI